MDNECSAELKVTMIKENIKWQLVPLHNHQADAAEHAIQTFKAHFKAILATTDPGFPIKEWDRLIPQAQTTVNLLRFARVNPKLSMHAYIFGNFHYNKTPIVPAGIQLDAHSKPTKRTSWALHGDRGWSIRLSPEHYQYIKVYFSDTRI